MAWVNGKILEVRSNQLLAYLRNRKAEDFIEPFGKSWKTDIVRQRFEWKDAKEILGIELPQTPSDDFPYWKFHPSGKFTIKTGYVWLVENNKVEDDRVDEEDKKFLKIFWKLNILPKWRIFI